MLLSTLTMSAQITTNTTALPYSGPSVPESVIFCGEKIDLTRFEIGTGKSVAINTIITDLALNYTPKELEMWIIDLKIVEMAHFKNLKHVKQYGKTVEEMMKPTATTATSTPIKIIGILALFLA